MDWPFSALTNVTSKKTIIKTDVSSVQAWLRNIRAKSVLIETSFALLCFARLLKTNRIFFLLLFYEEHLKRAFKVQPFYAMQYYNYDII